MEKKVKIICDHCKGNGFLRINASSFTEVHQCPTCKSQGEVKITEPSLEELNEMAKFARLQ